jgi:hypothetical protein
VHCRIARLDRTGAVTNKEEISRCATCLCAWIQYLDVVNAIREIPFIAAHAVAPSSGPVWRLLARAAVLGRWSWGRRSEGIEEREGGHGEEG